MMKRRFVAAVTIALAAFSILSYSSNASQSPQTTQSATAAAEGSTTGTAASEKASPGADAFIDEGGKTFGVTCQVESDFLKTVADSITSAAEVDGNKTVAAGAQQDSTKQIQVIKDFTAQDIDAVFLSPVDRDAVTPALQKLEGAEISVINFDSSVANLNLVDAYMATDNLQAGKLCAEAMVKDFPEGGLTAVLNCPANSACLDREKRFLGIIEGRGFEVAVTFDAESTIEKEQNITSDILQAHPDIVVIFSIGDQMGTGAYAAYTTSDVNVSICGVDGAPEAKQMIAREGSIYRMTVAQSPIEIGTNYYDVAMTILPGEKPAQFQIDIPAFTTDSTSIQNYLGAGQQQDASSGCAGSGMNTRTNEDRIKQQYRQGMTHNAAPLPGAGRATGPAQVPYEMEFNMHHM